MNTIRIGLVLAGGGGKGAYQIGAWRAFERFGIEFNVVAGTSIGAVNGLLMSSVDVNEATRIWLSLDKKLDFEKVKSEITLNDYINIYTAYMDPSYSVELVKYGGLFDQTELENCIRQLLYSANTFENFYVCTTKVTENPSAQYFNISKINIEKGTKAILASTSIPVIFEAVKIGNHYYYDGGLVNNVPIEPVMQNECDLIIIVFLDLKEVDKLKIHSKVPLIPIIPSESLGDFKTGVLNLKRKDVEKKMKLGYEDTCRVLSGLKGLLCKATKPKLNIRGGLSD